MSNGSSESHHVLPSPYLNFRPHFPSRSHSPSTMNSDLENIPPSLGLLPIRKLSSLIPLRKASRYHLSDPRDGSAFPALKTSTNTFQSSIPVKVAERRVPDDGRVVSKAKKEKLSTKTKMAMAPKPTATYAKLPASLAVHTTPRLPMSPPPEEELREQEVGQPFLPIPL